MDGFNRFNKISGVRWLKTSIEDLKIKIKLKPQDNIFTFRKFNDDTKPWAANEHQEKRFEEHIFNWQQKVFSASELKKYSDIHNCVSDIDLRYYELLKNNPTSCSKVFSYTDEDGYIQTPWQEKGVTLTKTTNVDLLSCLRKLNISLNMRNNLQDDNFSTRHLFKSQEFYFDEDSRWTAMHVLFDNFEHNEHTETILQQDAVLVSIYWNEQNRCLVISPDTNSLEWNPYTVETRNGVRWNYQYAVELDLHDHEEGNEHTEELVQLLKKLRKKWNEKHKDILSFVKPPIGLMRYYVILEIVSAVDFEEDNLYVEYKIKIPDNVEVEHNTPLKGRTHTSRCLKVHKDLIHNFGHSIDFSFDTKPDVDLFQISFFMEAISRDWCERHRTEGYAHLPLRLKPGQYTEDLGCVRPEEKDKVFADSRRYFIGGCNLLDDLEFLAKPQGIEPASDFRLVATGKIKVRWSVIRQVQAAERQTADRRQTTSSSALLSGADAALRRYRRARATLAAAAKGLDLRPETGIETPEDGSEELDSTDDDS